jgi:hypothetical protein
MISSSNTFSGPSRKFHQLKPRIPGLAPKHLRDSFDKEYYTLEVDWQRPPWKEEFSICTGISYAKETLAQEVEGLELDVLYFT